MDSGFIEYLKGKRRHIAILLLVALGLILIMLPFSDGGGDEAQKSDSLADYKATLETEVASIASSVKGVGKCRVLITFERGAQNTYKGSELIETKPPLVLGVTVVCTGGGSDYVRAELTEMLTALFNIPSSRVAVLKSG